MNQAFPTDFIWGSATASHQIESAGTRGGRGLCVWDKMCREPGRIADASSAELGVNYVDHMEADNALFASFGLQAFRFSLSWSRILPDGVGHINEQGLDFYDRQVDSLLKKGMDPWATLFHWDFPLALYHRGGWLNRDVVDWFADYTQIVVDRIGDRVKNWMTLNEPQCFIGLGHVTG